MRVHYVDDSRLDMMLVSRMFEHDNAVTLRTGEVLKDILETGVISDDDCVLLDVMRPDSHSLEDDVSAVRKVTRAPVIFVTGMPVEAVRTQAVAAGAVDVLGKDHLTRDIILETARTGPLNGALENNGAAIAAQRSHASDTFVNQCLAKPNSNAKEVMAATSHYLHERLAKLDDILQRDGAVFQLKEQIADLAGAARAMDTYVRSDRKAVERVDIARICETAQDEVDALAQREGVSVLWDVRSASYFQIGSVVDAVEAVKQLCMGVVRALPRHGTILVTTETSPEQEGAVLKIYGTSLYLPSDWGRFSRQVEERPVALDVQSSMSIALRLFGASQEQLSFSHAPDVTVLTLNL